LSEIKTFAPPPKTRTGIFAPHAVLTTCASASLEVFATYTQSAAPPMRAAVKRAKGSFFKRGISANNTSSDKFFTFKLGCIHICKNCSFVGTMLCHRPPIVGYGGRIHRSAPTESYDNQNV